VRCEGCPNSELDHEGDQIQHICYGMAAEACEVAMAWQERLAQEAG
jgi:hypothetical protein